MYFIIHGFAMFRSIVNLIYTNSKQFRNHMKNFALFENIQISFTDTGEGPVVVLLHGFLESKEIWRGFSDVLAGTCRVICIDLPGHGESGIITDCHSMELMAESVRSVLDHLQISKCHMVGHSMGGYVTMAFVEKYPERLITFTLFHSHPLADTPETKGKRQKEIALVKEGKKDLICNINIPNTFSDENLDRLKEKVEYAIRIGLNTSGPGLIAALKGMMTRTDRCDILKKTRLPFLWILGKKDNFIPYETIMEKVELPSNASVLSLDKSGHQGFMEEEKRSSGTILDLILIREQTRTRI